MSQATQSIQRLWFEPVQGPEMEGFWLEPEMDLLLGRGSDCDIKLFEASVSRQHGRLCSSEDGCFITDLGSRIGTSVNSEPCEKDVPVLITTGDVLQLGPCAFRASVRQGSPVAMQTIDDTGDISDQIQRLSRGNVGALAQHRLNLLIDCSERINAAATMKELGSLLVKSTVDGTGFQRAAMLMPPTEEGEIEVVAFIDGDSRDASNTTFSRSLIEGASRGDVSCLLSGDTGDYGQSIADLNIHSALCCGIFVDEELVAYLYLDAREQEQQIQPDAAGFCQALCRMAGLAYANLRRLEMQIEQARLEHDLSAAREAQQMMVPKDVGVGDVFSWGHIFRPGREASGDLLDIIPLSEKRMALVVGDVSGKGAGAAILMSAAQAFLHGRLCEGAEPFEAVTAVNKFVAQRSAMNRFLTLWVGIFDAESKKLVYVDAGHGHWAIRRANGTSEAPPTPDGFLVGIDATFEYKNAVLEIDSGDRIIIFSDGIPEQQTSTEEQYGVERVYDLVATSPSAEEDVKKLLDSVMKWAGGTDLDDDTTIVSLGFS
ncbi:MAG: SpoIIE family protein phosphatase [Planctomycetota bacterium]|nr:SpoIIE family protein phosphatase [Planctomycetota bacterium]